MKLTVEVADRYADRVQSLMGEIEACNSVWLMEFAGDEVPVLSIEVLPDE
jgi:hypothetical protein